LRTTFRWKADDLDAIGLQTRIGVSTLTIGGLLKHLAVVEDHTFTSKLSGQPLGEPWNTAEWDDEFEWPAHFPMRAFWRRRTRSPRSDQSRTQCDL